MQADWSRSLRFCIDQISALPRVDSQPMPCIWKTVCLLDGASDCTDYFSSSSRLICNGYLLAAIRFPSSSLDQALAQKLSLRIRVNAKGIDVDIQRAKICKTKTFRKSSKYNERKKTNLFLFSSGLLVQPFCRRSPAFSDLLASSSYPAKNQGDTVECSTVPCIDRFLIE